MMDIVGNDIEVILLITEKKSGRKYDNILYRTPSILNIQMIEQYQNQKELNFLFALTV